ncbi:MAG TPA: plastocyanin/azurin family copper-binding protein [Candidatus Eisenbacteria bacterium]|nr:plastocyanin/azurin family copper-binding protein [Candidatus Eisenbacteria bacterium]
MRLPRLALRRMSWTRLLFLGAGVCALLAFVLVVRPAIPRAAPAHDHMDMSPQAMQAAIDAWLSKHPESASAQPLADPVDTFLVNNFFFDNNGDGIGPDTAFIQPGDAVMWKWVSGTHTTTNGVDTSDPNAGTIWNHNINSASQTFTQVFPNEGTFPFFCVPHFSLGMKGAVVVQQAVAVRPLGDPVARIGFLSSPEPNPTSGRVLFRFGLRQAGLARAEILDARGRLIAVPVNDHLEPGSFSGVWNGLTSGGAHVSPGVYYVRLTVPGSQESRTIVLTP